MFYTLKIKSTRNPEAAFESALLQARDLGAKNVLIFESVGDESVSEIVIEDNETYIRYCNTFSPEQLTHLKDNVYDAIVAHRWDRTSLEECGIDIVYLAANRGTIIYYDYDSKAGHKQSTIRNGVPLNQRRAVEPELYTFVNEDDDDGSMVFCVVGRPKDKVKLYLHGAPCDVETWTNVIQVKGRRVVPGFTLDERTKEILKKLLGNVSDRPRTSHFNIQWPSFELVSLVRDEQFSAVGVVKDEYGTEYKFTCFAHGPVPVSYNNTMIDLRRIYNLRAAISEMQHELHAALVESTRA